MNQVDEIIAKAKLGKPCKYLIVSRRIYEQLMETEAQRKKLNEKDAFLIVVDVYKGLIVAVTDKKGINCVVI